jgi:hypothetical protein
MKKSENNKISIAENNRQMKDHFLRLVSGMNWKLLKKGESFEPGDESNFVIIGIAVWDNSSIGALAKLPIKHSNDVVFVFDVDDCSSAAEMEKFAPGVQGVSQVPIVAEYKGGKLYKTLQGKAALEWMAL